MRKSNPVAVATPDNRKTIEYLRDECVTVFTQLFPAEMQRGKIEIVDGQLSIFGGLWAEAFETIERRSLFGGKRSRKVKVQKFVYGVVEHQRNYPHEPDDYEPVEKGTCDWAYQAASALARLYFEDRLSNVLEEIGYAEQFAEQSEFVN